MAQVSDEKAARALRDRAQVAAAAGKHRQALDLYLQLEQLAPFDPAWPKRAGDTLRRLGDVSGAIGAFDRAADRYLRSGFKAQAIAMYRLILHIDPSAAAAVARLAELERAPRRR